MTTNTIATAMQRVQSVLQRRPGAGLHEDAPATARWQSGLRVVASHANGTQIPSDMPTELGGLGDEVTPGWLFRAGLASCLATCIAMHAASEGIELTLLEVSAGSRSDMRGVFGMSEADGAPVRAGPLDIRVRVRIAATGIAADRLRKLVEVSNRCSPINTAAREAVPMALQIDVEDA